MIIVFSANAQIRVDASGNIGLGITSPSNEIDIYGYTTINPNSWTGGFLFDKSGSSDMPTLKPNSPWWGSLGTSSNYFGYSYIKQMSSQTCLTETLRSNTHINNYGYVFSDQRIKTNINKIESPFELLLKLDGKKYNMLPPNQGLELKKEKTEKKDEYGFIAQDFMGILPELVMLDTITDLYAINYIGLIPIIVEALKEQYVINNSLLEQIEKLKGNTKEKSAFINQEPNTLFENAKLNQNIPNPFSTSTRIEMFLPDAISNATLCIYNMQGIQIQEYTIQERENTNVTIDGFTLNAGIYLYTLIADGKEVDTKKMILTK
ncbi:MAG: tail fiber domain-containing protein [Prolixibacteraceae bacterium]